MSVLLQIFVRFLTIVFLSVHILTELWYAKNNFFFLKTRTREHYFVNIIWGNFGWKLNSSLFSLDILSLDLVQVIKLLSSFIYFTVSRLPYWLLISNPVHNASGQYLFNLAKTLSFAWTNILVNNRWNLLLKLSELGF